MRKLITARLQPVLIAGGRLESLFLAVDPGAKRLIPVHGSVAAGA
jgi:hypothetical protein